MGEGKAWNASHVSLVRLAKCHGWLLLHRTFFRKVNELGRATALPFATMEVLQDLAYLFTLAHIEDR